MKAHLPKFTISHIVMLKIMCQSHFQCFSPTSFYSFNENWSLFLEDANVGKS